MFGLEPIAVHIKEALVSPGTGRNKQYQKERRAIFEGYQLYRPLSSSTGLKHTDAWSVEKVGEEEEGHDESAEGL